MFKRTKTDKLIHYGIFDKSGNCVAFNAQTTNSKATVQTVPGGPSLAIRDNEFTALTSSDVNLCSGIAKRVLSHTISGAVAYNSVWCDCYPWYVGLGGGYEFVSRKNRRHAFENWHVYGKVDISF